MRNPFSTTKIISSDHFTLLLRQCLKSKTLRPANQLHAVLMASGIDMDSGSLNSKLVALYASCGNLKYARLVFDKAKNPDVFALNWIISAMAFHGFHEDSLRYLSLMQQSKILPNRYTFPSVLKACVGLMDARKGKEVHAVVKRLGLEFDISVVNALIDMYCKCESLSYGRQLFDNMGKRDVASWTCMISGYCNFGQLNQASALFERMKYEGMEPNDFTWNVMIASYAKRGDCNGAFSLFSRMKREGLFPDIATWNAIISGFTQSNRNLEAMEVFREISIAGIKPNPVTVSGVLPACGVLNLVQRGKEIHGMVYRMGFEGNMFVGTALIDMYSKCGNVKGAWNVFLHASSGRNVAFWNAMIGCYWKNGMVGSAIELFERMQEEGVQANEVTLVCVLSSCSHGGLVEKGMVIFGSMEEKYGVQASDKHYACVIDLLCRAGKMVEAFEFVRNMRANITDSIVGAFFNGCKVHERGDLATMMEEVVQRMKRKRPVDFVILSNIHAAGGQWEEVEKMRKAMKEKRIFKMPGTSRVDKMDIEYDDLKMGSKSKKVIGICGGNN